MPDELKSPQQSTKRSSRTRLRKKKSLSHKSEKSLNSEEAAKKEKEVLSVEGVGLIKRHREIKGGHKWQVVNVDREKGGKGQVLGSVKSVGKRVVITLGRQNADFSAFEKVPGSVPVENEEIEQRKVIKKALAEISLSHEQMGVDHKEIEQLKTETRAALEGMRASLGQ